MELRHMRYFVAVAEELSFTRAAQRLHTSQPSLSEQVRKLEAEIGAPLLQRTRRAVALTEAGTVFLEEARRVLQQADQALARTRAVAHRARDTLTIGFVPSAEVWVFPTVLAALRLRFPETQMVLRSLTSGQLEQALERGEVDVAFLRPPPHGHLPHGEVVLVEPVRLFLRADHPLAREDRIDPAQLDRLRFVAVDRDYAHALHDLIAAYLHTHGIVPQEELASTNILLSMNMVAGSFDFTLLPAYAQAFSPRNVVSRPLVGGDPQIELIMATPHGEDASPAAAQCLLAMARTLAVRFDD